MNCAERAQGSPVKRGFWSWIWNPFLRVAGWPALGAGLACIALTAWVGSLTNTHFDGVLDAHTSPAGAPWWLYLAEGVINWLSLALVLLPMGFLVSRSRFRVIDLLGTQALARWPLLLAATALLLPGYTRVTESILAALRQGKMEATGLFAGVSRADAGAFAAALLVLLLCTVWFVSLSWKSFRVSCDARGGKAVGLFVVAMVLAEILSKLAILGLASTLG